MMRCFFVKQKTAYEMRISDWSSGVCSSDLHVPVEVEMRVLLPSRTRRGVDRLVPEARVGQEALFDDALEPLQRHRLGEHQQAGDHPRVGRPLHAQPGGVDPRPRFAAERLAWYPKKSV